MLSLKTETDVVCQVADSLRGRRLTLGWRQEDLAERSGVAIATLRRFERSGQIGFKGLTKLIVTLGLTEDFLAAFKPAMTAPKSIDAFLAGAPSPRVRQRARRPLRKN